MCGVYTGMFEQSIIADAPKTRKGRALFVSFLAQITICGVLLLIPLVYTDAITLFPEFTPPVVAPVVKPPEPPEIKPMQTKAAPSRSTPRPWQPPVLTAPPTKPTTVVVIHDDFGAPPETGFTGGPTSIAIEGPGFVLSSRDLPRPPEPPKPTPVVQPTTPEPKPTIPVKISGGVQAAKLISKVIPAYPAIARQVRAQGTVRLHAIIGRDGKVRDLQVVEGHPLLRQAAVEAVRQWVYSPTILGTDAVEVDTIIDVNFVLN